MTKYLYQFEWNYRRGGSVEGLFVATEDEVKALVGRHVNFGEALGKHSEVYGEINPGDVKKLDLASKTVEEVAKLLGRTWSGYNPFSYLYVECSDCGMTCSEDDAEVEGVSYREGLKCTLCDDCYTYELDE